jgi:hypothetical protein
VLDRRRYNLRGDNRRGSVRSTDALLSARLILLWSHDAGGRPTVVQLYERTGPWQVVTAAELASDGYPSTPRARVYLVSAINPTTSAVEAMVLGAEQLPLPDDHRPLGSTWEQIALAATR